MLKLVWCVFKILFLLILKLVLFIMNAGMKPVRTAEIQ